jgi:plasmid maintenance system antidote protein VapI
MEETIKERIKQSGKKQKFLAETIGVSENFFSMCIRGKRNLSQPKQEKLKSIL